MNANILADTKELSNNEWLELRKKGIGGSDIAGILGLSKWQSPLSLYLDKVSENRSMDDEENEYIEWGNTLEPIIRDKFPAKFRKVTGKKITVQEYSYMMQSKEHSFMLANIDGVVTPNEDYDFKIQVSEDEWQDFFIPAGLTGGLEIKTVSGFTAKNWKSNALPDGYFLQTQHYMAVTGLPYFWVVALIDKKMVWRYVPRDEEIISIIIEKEKQFWENHVLAKIPPAPIGMDADADSLKMLYPEEIKEKSLDLSNMAEKRLRYKEITEEIKLLQKEQNAIKQEFMAALGDAEIAFVGDKKVTWKTQAGCTYQVKREPTRILRIG